VQGSSTEEESAEGKEKAEGGPEPLAQLLTAFSRSATIELVSVLEADFLYISYATIMGQVYTNLYFIVFFLCNIFLHLVLDKPLSYTLTINRAHCNYNCWPTGKCG